MTKRKYQPMYQPGSGVHFPFGKPSLGELRRIERLGKLNDRYTRARAEADRWEMIEVSYAYDEIGCPIRAASLRAEASEICPTRKSSSSVS